VSLLNAVGFLRFLNVNLAILNLLPIPVLDGGHVLFSLWEGITRRRAHPRFVNILVNTFAGLLIAVFLLLTVMDVRRSPRLFRAFRTALKMRDNGAATVQEPQGANGK
jgi:membrane-associated protease RseP (regulator of RpoE activity)